MKKMKKKAQDGSAVSNKFTISAKQAPDTIGKKPSKVDTTKSFESNKFTIPKKTMKSGGKIKKK